MDLMANETSEFIHSGVVSEIKDSSIIVSLDQNVHCETCAAKGACGISDTASRRVEIADSNSSFKLYEPVEVVLRKDLGQKAVIWAYLFPFVLVLATLVLTSFLFAEWLAGVLSLLILVPYYAVLYILKNYFREAFKITVSKV